jgi:DNA helicase HerA-like ATPase
MSGLNLEPRHRVLVCGKTQHGKTHFARELVKHNAPRFDRVVIFDVDEEYRARVTTAAQLVLNPALLDKGKVLTVRSTGDSAHRLALDCRHLLKLVRASKGTSLVVLEEPGRYARHWCHKCIEPLAPLLEEAATGWAKRGVCLLFVTQRANQIPLTVRSQLSTIVSFRQDESGDVDALADRAGKNFAGAVVSLKPRDFRVWRDDAPHPEHAEGALPS